MISRLENINRIYQNWNQGEKNPEKVQQNKNCGSATKGVTYAWWDCQTERKGKKQLKESCWEFPPNVRKQIVHPKRSEKTKQNKWSKNYTWANLTQTVEYQNKGNSGDISSMKNTLPIEEHKHSYQAYKEHSLRCSVS